VATRADIEVNVKGLKKVQELSKQLDKVSGKVNQLNRTSGTKTEKQTASFEEKRAASMVRVRNIGDQIQKAKEAGLKTDKASRSINKAALANDQGKLKLAKAHTEAALNELKAEQSTTKELANQLKFSKLLKATRSRGGGAAARPDKFNDRSNAAAARSGLISGAFPLLFGQGIAGGATGFAGGFVGTKLGGQMGGFAGGLVATAVLQQVTQAVTAVGELGQALNPLTADINKLTSAVGLAGTAEAARIKLLEQVEGKQVALAAATDQMALVIGNDGVAALDEFGSRFGAIQSNMSEFSLRLQSKFAKMFNAIIEKFPGIFGDDRTPAQNKVFTDLVEKDEKVLSINKEIADAEKLVKDLELKEAKLNNPGIGLPKAPSFFKGGSALFPSQLPSLDEQVNTEQDKKNNKDDLKNAREKLNLAQKNLQSRKEAIAITAKNTVLEDEVNKITDLTLRSTEKNVALLKAKRDGNIEEVEVQEKVKEIIRKITDLGIEGNLIDKQKIEDLVTQEQELEKQVETANKLDSAFKSIATSIADDIKEGIKGLIKGTSTLSDLLNNVADKFLDVALNQALFGDILGSKGDKGGGLLGFLGFANGGRPPVNRPSIVGEKGPELFVPRSSGNIIPNNKLGGGGSTSVVVNVDASGSDVQGDEAAAKEIGTLISVAVQGELLKQQRPGGLLSR